MAAMKARRPGRQPPNEPPRRGRRRAPVQAEPISRLAAIKLSGGLTSEETQVTGRSLAIAIAGFVLFSGMAIAGATWIGGSLFDAREAFARTADSAAAGVGFAADDIEVHGIAGARAQEVRAMVVPEGRQSIIWLDPDDVKDRVESLDWVASASVRRLWPSRIEVTVERRQAYAIWQQDGEFAVIDVVGERLLAERAVDHANLPLIVGRGAGPAAQDLLVALEDLPALRARLKALVRVHDRRWNVELRSGTRIALPETNPAIALAQLEALQASHRLLDRPLAQIDLRTPGRMAVRIHPALAGGPLALAGGA